MAWYAVTSPSSALMPACGAAAACAARPRYSTSTALTASTFMAISSRLAGWIIIAASTSSKAPSRAIRILPPPPSSAGVPSTTTLPPVSRATTRERDAGAGAGRRDDVVAAAVADPGQGVVLAQHGDARPPLPRRAAKAVGSP